MIKCQNVSFSYDMKNKVLKKVNLHLETGKIGVIIGLNGCGKTTLLKCIGKSINNYKGTINTSNKTCYINDLPDDCENLTGKEYLNKLYTFLESKKRNLIDTMIKFSGINDDINKRIKLVSLYTRQILIILTAICFDSDTLLLDEPFLGLDRNSQLLIVEIIKLLKAEGKTILIGTNLMYFGFNLADTIFILHQGKVKQINNGFINHKYYDDHIFKLLF
ncbi:MAG TPA: ATP-binding cassette domain-containing protein, partial [Haloplasmataceae bacterium]